MRGQKAYNKDGCRGVIEVDPDRALFHSSFQNQGDAFKMPYRIAADSVVIVHGLFICFVVLGGLLAARRRWLMVLHLPAAAWGAYIELKDGICPLTPLEQGLRRAAGNAGYTGGFVEHYITPLIYPEGLTPGMRFALGAFVVSINGGIYGFIFYRRFLRKRRTDSG